jgi:tetratricopeptide (TPR) repeat protein
VDINQQQIEDAEKYYISGFDCTQQGNLDTAIKDFTEAIHLDPKYFIALCARGEAYRLQGDLDAAIQDCTKAIYLAPKYLFAYYVRGAAYLSKRNLDAAIQDCTNAIRINPNYVEAYIIRGNAYLDKEEIETAIGDFAEAIRLDPNYTLAYYNCGIAYSKLGNFNAAIEEFTEAIRLDPNYTLAYYYRGIEQAKSGNFQAAIFDNTKIIESDPQYKWAFNNRGWSYSKQGNFEAAIKDCTEAIRLDPTLESFYDSRGEAYCKQGNLIAAICDYSEAIRLNPGYVHAYNGRGDVNKLLGNLEAAERDYSQANLLNNSDIKKNIHIMSDHTPKVDPDQSLHLIFDELNNMTGLVQAKAEVRQLIQFVRVQKLRQLKGMGVSGISLHSVFYGSPGTGKTTVARIYAKMLHTMGLLAKGHLVETDRAGLVANYIGQTATKTDEKVNEALGGVLFIDEAYSLYKGDRTEWDYGGEAIEIIMKRMEDHRDNLAVIVAGYPEPMDDFLNSNEGFKSRFVNYIHFEDYSPDELFKIFLKNCNDNQYTMSKDASESIRKVIDKAYVTKDKSFGNARFCRNLFEKIIRFQSIRLGDTINNPTLEQLNQIEAEDIIPFLK